MAVLSFILVFIYLFSGQVFLNFINSLLRRGGGARGAFPLSASRGSYLTVVTLHLSLHPHT